MIKLSKKQELASKHLNGAALTLAVPGSGKTTLIIARTIMLIDKYNIDPQSILTVTFSKAAAEDMKKRFKTLYPNHIHKTPNFMTIHSFCFNILKQYYKKKNINLNLIQNKFMIIKNILLSFSDEKVSDDSIENIINEISYVKNMMLNKDELKSHSEYPFFEKIYLQYENYKSQNNLIDFDDMLTLTYDILKGSKNALKFLQDKYKYIQVDEAQDTSNIQFEILRLLSGLNNNIFMVADDDQSIYSFRGANPLNLLELDKYFKEPTIYYLSENYRSTKEICTVSNEFIKQNKVRYKKDIIAYNQNQKHLPINLTYFEDLQERNDFLLDYILSAKSEENIGILFRNNVSCIGISYLLYKHDIDFLIKDKGISQLNHFAINHIISYMKLALADNDINSFKEIAMTTDSFISKNAVSYVINNNNGNNVFDTLLNYKSESPIPTKKIKKYKAALVDIKNSSALESIRIIEREFGYLRRFNSSNKLIETNVETIRKIFTQIKIIARTCKSITEFILEIEEFKKFLIKNKSDFSSNINLSTYHSSKGLEYDTVFIIDCEQKSQDSKQKLLLEEEVRLFYVAMTRAKTNLNILQHKFEEGQHIKKLSFVSFLEEQKTNDIKINQPNLKTIDTPDLDSEQTIYHVKFGKGIVLQIDNDTITIKFNDMVRNLSYSLCKEKGLLQYKS